MLEDGIRNTSRNWLIIFLVLIALFTYLGLRPESTPSPAGRSDIIAHVLRHAVFVIIAYQAFRGRNAFLVALLGLAVYAAVIEWLQTFSTNRNPSMGDFVAAVSGIGLGLISVLGVRGTARIFFGAGHWAEATPAALDLVLDAVRIDPQIMKALDFSLPAVDTAGRAQPAAVLSASDSLKLLADAGSRVPGDGFLKRIKSYVGEGRVAGLLDGAEFPSTPSYPDVDLFTADGGAVQIKTSLDQLVIRNALAGDPNRLVVVPEEMAHVRDQFPNARSLVGFSVKELEEATRRNVKSLLGLPGRVGVYVAAVSLGTLAARYTWKGLVGRRTWENAAFLKAVDGTGKAVGGDAGAAARVLIGDVLAPLTLGLSLPLGIVAGSIAGITAESSFFMGLFQIESEADALIGTVRANVRKIRVKLEARWEGVISALTRDSTQMSGELRQAMIRRAQERTQTDLEDWDRLAEGFEDGNQEERLKHLTTWFLAHPDLPSSVPGLLEPWEKHQAMLEAAAVAQNHPLERVRMSALQVLADMVEGGTEAIGRIVPEDVAALLKAAGGSPAEKHEGASRSDGTGAVKSCLEGLIRSGGNRAARVR